MQALDGKYLQRLSFAFGVQPALQDAAPSQDHRRILVVGTVRNHRTRYRDLDNGAILQIWY